MAHPQPALHHASQWEGEASPLTGSWIKLMMWLFLLSDTLTFAGLLAGYGYLRLSTPGWPNPGEIFSLGLVSVMTFILICSSATMAMAVAAAHRQDWRAVVRFVGYTILGGLAFLGLQAYEWSHFIAEGARLGSNPWGVPLFSASFFIITGFHGGHVTGGVLYLLSVARRARQQRLPADRVEAAGLYWHFVDLVWVFIFTVMYLI